MSKQFQKERYMITIRRHLTKMKTEFKHKNVKKLCVKYVFCKYRFLIAVVNEHVQKIFFIRQNFWQPLIFFHLTFYTQKQIKHIKCTKTKICNRFFCVVKNVLTFSLVSINSWRIRSFSAFFLSSSCFLNASSSDFCCARSWRAAPYKEKIQTCQKIF